MDKPISLVVIPALNEEGSIGEVLREVRSHVRNADILVINDGSTDRTATIAREMGVMVIDLPFNLGYGAALQTGFRFADRYGYDFVVTIDADGQHEPASVEQLFSTMERENADIVIGSRFLEGGYRTGIPRQIGIWLFSKIARLYTGIDVTDPTSGFQLLRRAVFSHLARGDNYPHDYPDVNIVMALHKKKFRLAEAPVVMVNNQGGKSMHSGMKPVLYILKMVLAIIMVIMRKEES